MRGVTNSALLTGTVTMPKKSYLHILIIALTGLAVYSNAFTSPFLFDDIFYITENHFIRNLGNFADLSGTRYIGLLSFALNYAAGGLDPIGYNLINISIHLINATLLYLMLSLLMKTPALSLPKESATSIAFIAALIFVVHPVESQAVNYTTQRFATLATLFYLLSICLYISSRICHSSPGRAGRALTLYLLAFLSCLLAQKTKEISFTLPFMILLIEFAFIRVRSQVNRSPLYLLPFFLTLLIIPLSLGMEGGADATAAFIKRSQVADLLTLSPIDYLTTEIRVLLTYIRLMVLPVGLNLIYDYPRYGSFLSLPVLSSLAFLALLAGGAVLAFVSSLGRGRPMLLLSAFGILWFFITASVESSVIPIKDVIFEHRLYLPSGGAFLALSVLLVYLRGLFGGGRGLAGWAPVAMIILALALTTYSRNKVWADEIRLWSDVAAKSPALAGPQINLGIAYENALMMEDATTHYEAAISLDKKNFRAETNLGAAYARTGEPELAEKHLSNALVLNEGFARGHYNIAKFYSEGARTKEAITHYQKAIELNPYNDMSYNNLAVIYYGLGEESRALELLGEAVRLNPSNREARANLKALEERGARR